jgi:hypothetical protein
MKPGPTLILEFLTLDQDQPMLAFFTLMLSKT